MWLSGQQKRPAREGGGQTGVVTMAGEDLAVRLDSEVRSPELYGPAGYRWTPRAGDRVLVLKGEGETPCVVGVRQGGAADRVTIAAGRVELQGSVFINGVPLEQYIALLAGQTAEGSE